MQVKAEKITSIINDFNTKIARLADAPGFLDEVRKASLQIAKATNIKEIEATNNNYYRKIGNLLNKIDIASQK